MNTMAIEAHGKTLRLQERPGIISHCWKRGKVFEAPLLEHIYQQRFTGLALDVGANIGNHSLWLALVCGLHVIAFEPIHHDALAANVRLNKADVTIEPYALGEKEGKAIHVGRGKLEDGDGWIRVKTLDAIGPLGRRVAVMKIDVEGMEAAVLRGGERTIRRDQPVIYAEAWDKAHLDEQSTVLTPWGYRVTEQFEQHSHYRGRIAVLEWRVQ